jgi:hypothetical protein
MKQIKPERLWLCGGSRWLVMAALLKVFGFISML